MYACSTTVGLGAVALVGAYACMLYRWQLQLRRNQLYLDAAVRAVEVALRVRYGRVRVN